MLHLLAKVRATTSCRRSTVVVTNASVSLVVRVHPDTKLLLTQVRVCNDWSQCDTSHLSTVTARNSRDLRRPQTLCYRVTAAL